MQEAYDIMVNLTILLYFVPYMYVFAAFLWLRREPAEATVESRRFRVPGGAIGAWAFGACGFTATFVAIALVFIPPTGTENVLNYEANPVGQSALLFVVGAGFYIARLPALRRGVEAREARLAPLMALWRITGVLVRELLLDGRAFAERAEDMFFHRKRF